MDIYKPGLIEKYLTPGTFGLDVKPPKRPKQFDSRLLDQLECLCDEYRYWYSDKVDDLPVGYRIEQREAIRVRLRETAIRAAKALDGLD